MIKSLKTRIAVWYIALSTAILLGFGLAIYFTLSHGLRRDRENLLRADCEQVRGLARTQERRGRDEFVEELGERFGGKPGEFIQATSVDGNIIYSTSNLKDRQIPFKPELASNGQGESVIIEDYAGPEPVLLTVIRLWPTESGNPEFVTLAVSLASVHDAEQRLLFILLLSIPIAIVISLAGGAILARRAIDPVDQVTATARQITAQSLNERITLINADEELQRLADAFNQMVTRLEDAFNQIRQFTADASHELRTPLAVLTGETQLALTGNLNRDESLQVFKSSLEEIERMSKIVDDLLVLSRFDSKDSVLDIQKLDLSDLVIETCEQMRKPADARHLNLVIEKVETLEVMGDDFRLRQVIRNLLDNAIKYTPEGGQIKVSLETNGSQNSYITIIDTGIGIPSEDLTRIFDRFYRVDKARSRTQGGSGLGLSIVKRVIEAHNGKIEIESQLGVGTKVSIHLPKSP